jgi:hypothetical protein
MPEVRDEMHVSGMYYNPRYVSIPIAPPFYKSPYTPGTTIQHLYTFLPTHFAMLQPAMGASGLDAALQLYKCIYIHAQLIHTRVNCTEE